MMTEKTNALGLVVARGGSKRIPRKNIQLFLGKPIIQYVINAALSSACFDTVMVSTDDEEIASVSKAAGAEVPFLRSPATAGDFATTADVIQEVLTAYESIGKSFTYCCCLYPTGVLVQSESLRKANQLIRSVETTSVIPVVPFSYPVQRALQIESSGMLSFVERENTTMRSQDLPVRYHDAGQFYFLRVEDFRRTKAIFQPGTRPLVLSDLEAQDIDTPEDWRMAEIKFELLKKR